VPVRALEAIAGTPRCEAWFAAILPRIASPGDARAIVGAGLRLRARSESLAELRGVDVVRFARDIRANLIVVNGAFDWPTRAGEGAIVAAARSAQCVVAPGVGHGVGFFAPGVFAEAIASALTRVAAGPVRAV
jgi:pimeloyl-ACP methyl ester carboxylesterase